MCFCHKVPTPTANTTPQPESELEPPFACLPPLGPRGREAPASPAWTCEGPANIPLHHASTSHSRTTIDVTSTIHMVLTCIDICVVMLTMFLASSEASHSHSSRKKQSSRRHGEDTTLAPHGRLARYGLEEDELEHPHRKQVIDLLAWHIGVENARWYVKPRSTCWFEEYLFNIYTPDMFYDILRMSRRTFDRLVHDLRPFIQGQHTHWRQPIGVEKKVVVTLFKLMHGVVIPLVADKAALGKSTVGEILRLVCGAICDNFGHLVAWPVGRRLSRIAAGFQSKQRLPNCIGAIDGSHIYIVSPSNTIVAADHRNRNKSFSILLQGVVDSRCYFTSINTGPPGSLHDSAHFKSTELYRKVGEGTMGGFHDDPLTWPTCLPFPPYLVADRGYPLLSWCITPFKMGPMGIPLTREEMWFNRKHSSTRMNVERSFGILKSKFREIGTKSSLKLDFLPTVVHCCCILHNILLASKDITFDQILIDCNLPPMDVNDLRHGGEEEAFQPPRPMGLVSEERALLEDQMAREDLLDYLIRIQNDNHFANQPARRTSRRHSETQ